MTAVFLALNVYLVPCKLSKMDTEEALGVKLLIAVYKIDLAANTRCRSVKLQNICCSTELDLIEIFTASFHSRGFLSWVLSVVFSLSDNRIIYAKDALVNGIFEGFFDLDACTSAPKRRQVHCLFYTNQQCCFYAR